MTEIVNQIKEIALNSGVPFELDITEVTSLAERAKKITSVKDENFSVIKKELQQKRKYVTDYMKDAREGFNKQAKAVIQIQNTILDEFTPEENRLIALDKAEKERIIKKERLESLPQKRERITKAGIEFTDEEILEMVDADFEIEFNARWGAKLEEQQLADQKKREEEQAKLEEDRLALEREKQEAERIEKAREEEREQAEEALRIQKETAEREKKEAEERHIAEEQERILAVEREEEAKKRAILDAELKAKEIEAQKQADAEYQAFLKENKYNEKTDIIKDGTKIYRFVAEFKNK